MRVRITMPSKDGKRLKDKLLALVSKVEDDDWGEEWELVRPFLVCCVSSCEADSG